MNRSHTSNRSAGSSPPPSSPPYRKSKKAERSNRILSPETAGGQVNPPSSSPPSSSPPSSSPPSSLASHSTAVNSTPEVVIPRGAPPSSTSIRKSTSSSFHPPARPAIVARAQPVRPGWTTESGPSRGASGSRQAPPAPQLPKLTSEQLEIQQENREIKERVDAKMDAEYAFDLWFGPDHLKGLAGELETLSAELRAMRKQVKEDAYTAASMTANLEAMEPLILEVDLMKQKLEAGKAEMARLREKSAALRTTLGELGNMRERQHQVSYYGKSAKKAEKRKCQDSHGGRAVRPLSFNFDRYC